MMKNIRFNSLIDAIKLFVLTLLFTTTGCLDSEEVLLIPPSSDDLSFTYTVDSENPNIIHFVGQTIVDTWYYHWNFGDNTGDEQLETSKVFFKKGEYDVRFKIFTEGGSASVIQRISIVDDFQGPDLISNGSLDSANDWNIFQISGGVEVELAAGVAKWSGGGWGNAGLWQQIEFEANKEYQINMDVSGGAMSDCWFEVFVGTVQPQEGVDYSDGGILMGINTWEGCGSELFSGQLTDVACVGDGGSLSWPMDGTAFFVIKSGGNDLGEGVTVDNIAIRSI